MKRTTVRFSPSTQEKLEWLVKRYGTQAKVFTVAIDRLYHQERDEFKSVYDHKDSIPDDKIQASQTD